MSDETDTTSEVARVLLDHDAERMECMDHDRLCCPTCDAHDFASAYEHQADALAEAGLLRDHRECAPIDSMRHAADAANTNHEWGQARLRERDEARSQVERVRAQFVRMTKSSDAKTQRHGTALLHILDGTDTP